jgi:UDP-N-acetylmuramate--alanine ligase
MLVTMFQVRVAVGGTMADDDNAAGRGIAGRRRLDPTVIMAASSVVANAAWKGDWMVVESDGRTAPSPLPADIVIVTNIDPEHLDHYGTGQGEAFWPSSKTFHSMVSR